MCQKEKDRETQSGLVRTMKAGLSGLITHAMLCPLHGVGALILGGIIATPFYQLHHGLTHEVAAPIVEYVRGKEYSEINVEGESRDYSTNEEIAHTLVDYTAVGAALTVSGLVFYSGKKRRDHKSKHEGEKI